MWVTTEVYNFKGYSRVGVDLASYMLCFFLSHHLNLMLYQILRSIFMTQLSATDISVQASMKNAAKCDNHCELQNSVNQWIFERILHFWVIPGSMPASVLVETMQLVLFFVRYITNICNMWCMKWTRFCTNCSILTYLLVNLALLLQHEVRSANLLNLSI